MIGGLFPPRPRLAPARGDLCACGCHTEAEDGQRPAPAINGLCAKAVERRDVIAAVCACDACRRFHAVVFSGRPKEIGGALGLPLDPPPPPRPVVTPYVERAVFGGGDGPE
jgi:hypothetical protein